MSEDEHPWNDFLEARKRAIVWLYENGHTDEDIAEALSISESRVYTIRAYPERA